jgi:hypothetical protein
LAFDLIHHQYPVALQNQYVHDCSQKVLQEHNTPVAHLHRLDSKFNKGSSPLRKGHEKGHMLLVKKEEQYNAILVGDSRHSACIAKSLCAPSSAALLCPMHLTTAQFVDSIQTVRNFVE